MPGGRQQSRSHPRSGEDTRGHRVAQPEQRVCGGGLCGAPRVCVCAGGQTSTRSNTQRRLFPHQQQHFGVELVGVAEGSELAELWELLGTARTRYPDKGCAARVVPRLFVCSVASGAFNVDEVAQFSQDDLDADDAIILDAHTAQCLCESARARTPPSIGSPWTPQLIAAVCAQPSATPSRPRHVPCLRVVQFEEPITFTTNFHGWQDKPPNASTTKNGIRSQNRAQTSPTQRSDDGT